MTNWKETTLGEVVDLIIDHRGLTPKKLGGDWSRSGYRAISAKSIKNGQLVNEDQMNLLSEDLYKKWMKEGVEYGDIFLTSEAPLGEHVIWKSEEKLVLSQRIFGIRTKRNVLDPFFFNYFIDSKYYQHQLKSRESGSTVTGIKQSELLKTKVLLPPIEEQKEIAGALGSLDDKIELLRKENETLEKIAQTIFKEWFVNFNFPNAEGKPYKSSGGKMIDSDLGEIPEGWRAGRLGDLLSLEYGKPMKEEDRTGIGYPVFGSNGIVGYHKDFLVRGDGIVVGRKGTMGSVVWVEDNFYPIDTAFYVQDKLGINKLFFHFLFLRNQDLERVGSDSAVPGLNRNSAYAIETVIPKIGIVEVFSETIEPIFSKIKLNNSQIQTLSTLRDTLLPKLMSGKSGITARI